MARYSVTAAWEELGVGGMERTVEHTWELDHQPAQDELDTLAKNSMQYFIREQYVDGNARIVECTELPD